MKGGGSKAACKCTIRKIEQNYTLKEFEKILGKFEKTNKLPAKITKLATACGKAHPS